MRLLFLPVVLHVIVMLQNTSLATPILPAALILEDGLTFEGTSFGFVKNATGEVIFTTSMVGYVESLTDPSFSGQILVNTFPLIGNYGVPRNITEQGLSRHYESDRIHVAGLIVSSNTDGYSHWTSHFSLSKWILDSGIPAIYGIDTRRLTKHLQSRGLMKGQIIIGKEVVKQTVEKYNWVPYTYWDRERTVPVIDGVSTRKVQHFGVKAGHDVTTILVFDCGVKHSIIRKLLRAAKLASDSKPDIKLRIKVVPYNHDGFKYEDENIVYVSKSGNVEKIHGVLISNGPGDPQEATSTIQIIKKFIATRDGHDATKARPLFGLCLGHQILAIAAGASTYKLPFGHRGQNHPVMDMLTGRTFISPMNHGYAVNATQLEDYSGGAWKPLFKHLNDGSSQGIFHISQPWFSAQFHPEASGGPHDTFWLLKRFVQMSDEWRKNRSVKSIGESWQNAIDHPGIVENTIIGGNFNISRTNKVAAQTSDYSTVGKSTKNRSRAKPKIKTVLLLGSGAIQIGQAGEFDYSGSQAIKALKEEGMHVLLINPNVASVQTSEGLADEIFFVPIDEENVEAVIAQERPDGILLTFGGQSALNCGIKLYNNGVLEKYNVIVMGTPLHAIIAAEDRAIFRSRIIALGESLARSSSAKSVKEALQVAEEIGYPVLVRSAFSLGGQGSGFAHDTSELSELVDKALVLSPQVLIDESLEGWKEVEYEVIRDCDGNTLTVCNMENFDPVGIHTGDSIVVAPSQTLTDADYHRLRSASLKIINDLGIIGECNIQFGMDPLSDRFVVIEVNPRLSRSSALASKATGYPLAYIGAKLALGFRIHELRNAVTKVTPAFFEPSLDYVVVKMPRFDFAQFGLSGGIKNKLGSAMQSVGEVLAIGRNMGEALQKALRMLNKGYKGFEALRKVKSNSENSCRENIVNDHECISEYSFDGKSNEDLDDHLYNYMKLCNETGSIKEPLHISVAKEKFSEKSLIQALTIPTETRILAIWSAFTRGWSVEYVSKLTNINTWFLEQLMQTIQAGHDLCGWSLKAIKANQSQAEKCLRIAKEWGYSDIQIASRIGFATHQEEFIAAKEIRKIRKSFNITPVVKQIDTLAGEYAAVTNYLYTTYTGKVHDVQLPSPANGNNLGTVMVVGSGVYHIGSSVEFDSSTVAAARSLRQRGYSVIMINSNPETVSTDYDESDRLYFDEVVSFERVLDIYDVEQPLGIILAVGGQTSNSLAYQLHQEGCQILGTPPEDIAIAENRASHSALLDKYKLQQPLWREVDNVSSAVGYANTIGYPVLIRPSGVLGGSAVSVAYSSMDIHKYLVKAFIASNSQPVVITKFYENALEIDVDAVALYGKLQVYAISEHVEFAGVHSGDATLIYPSRRLSRSLKLEIRRVMGVIADALNITGPFNIQALVLPKIDEDINNFDTENFDKKRLYIIETNVRASRSMPFVSKASGIDFIEVGMNAVMDKINKSTHNNNKLLSACDYIEGIAKMKPTIEGVVAVKVPQFSYRRVSDADPVLSVSMHSTGEVVAFGKDRYEAYITALRSVGLYVSKPSLVIGKQKPILILLLSASTIQKGLAFVSSTMKLGFKIYSVMVSSNQKKNKNVDIHVEWDSILLGEKRNASSALELIKTNAAQLVVDFTFMTEAKSLRRATVDYNIPLITNSQQAYFLMTSLMKTKHKDKNTVVSIHSYATWRARLWDDLELPQAIRFILENLRK